MENKLFKNWLPAALLLLAAFLPSQFNKAALGLTNPIHAMESYTPVAAQPAIRPAVRHDSLHSALRTVARSYTYTFAGQATLHGRLLSNSNVTLRVTSDNTSNIYRATTDEDGRFQLNVPVDGIPSEMLLWEITSVTKDLTHIGTEGHQILPDGPTVQTVTSLPLAEI